MIVKNQYLDENDQLAAGDWAKQGLYFLHIPKTAGTSLRYWLHDLFAESDWLSCYGMDELQVRNSIEIQNHRFFSGHFGLRILDYLDRRPTTITWLRDPVKRTISSYLYMRENHDQLVQLAPEKNRDSWLHNYDRFRTNTLVDLLNDPLYVGYSDNMQTRYLSGTFLPTDPILISQDELDCAKANLEKLFFVGICEWMDASTDALCYDLKVPHRRLDLNFNRTGQSSKQDRVSFSTADMAKIEESEKYDRDLYRFGCQLLETRFQKLWKRVRPHEAGLDMTSISERLRDPAVLNEIKQTINSRFNESISAAPRQTSGRLNFSDAVHQSGWMPRFESNSGRFVRWAGPQNSASVFFPFAARHDYVVEFTVRYIASQPLLRSLSVVANGIPVPVQISDASPTAEGANEFQVRFRVPAVAIRTRLPLTEIVFSVLGPLQDVGMAGGDVASFATDEFRFYGDEPIEVTDYQI